MGSGELSLQNLEVRSHSHPAVAFDHSTDEGGKSCRYFSPRLRRRSSESTCAGQSQRRRTVYLHVPSIFVGYNRPRLAVPALTALGGTPRRFRKNPTILWGSY